jgi:signal transduction histidine kinase
MTLKFKILLILSMIFSLYAFLEYGIQHYVVYPNFIALENDEARRNIKHCVQALERERSYLAVLASELAVSDGLGKFIGQDSKDYPEENLLPPQCRGEHVDFICIYDKHDKPFWSREQCPDGYEAEKLRKFMSGFLADKNSKIRRNNDGIIIDGLMPILTASRAIIKTGTNAECGTVVLGKLLTIDYIKKMGEQADIDFRYSVIADENLTPYEKDIFEHIMHRSEVYIHELGENLLQVHTIFEDIEGKPALLLRSHATKEFSVKGIQAINATLLVMSVAGLSAVLILVTLLQFLIIAPVKKLIKHFKALGRSEDTYARLSMSRKDEIGILAREFDHMVDRLDEARQKLLEKSYLSGMAEMSSAVLHNARNSLSPILSCIDRLRQQLKDMPVEKLEMAQVELSEKEVSSQRRDDLNQFINLANKSVIGVLQETQVSLDDLSHQVSQMEEMLAGQKTFRGVERPMENVELSRLFEDAINLVPSELRKQVHIEVEESIQKITPIMVHRVALLQVFQNILINAAESLTQCKPLYAKINISAENEKVEGVEMVHVQIVDNGEGISPEKINKIFERGVSSKRKGLTGIGLHWCGNTISALGGRIYAESGGEKCGACFHIVLPVSQRTSNSLVKEGK